MKKPILSRLKKRKPDASLFLFTAADEIRIERACRNAAEFMQTYGQGRQPYMVDLRYYFTKNSNQIEQ